MPSKVFKLESGYPCTIKSYEIKSGYHLCVLTGFKDVVIDVKSVKNIFGVNLNYLSL